MRTYFLTINNIRHLRHLFKSHFADRLVVVEHDIVLKGPNLKNDSCSFDLSFSAITEPRINKTGIMRTILAASHVHRRQLGGVAGRNAKFFSG